MARVQIFTSGTPPRHVCLNFYSWASWEWATASLSPPAPPSKSTLWPTGTNLHPDGPISCVPQLFSNCSLHGIKCWRKSEKKVSALGGKKCVFSPPPFISLCQVFLGFDTLFLAISQSYLRLHSTCAIMALSPSAISVPPPPPKKKLSQMAVSPTCTKCSFCRWAEGGGKKRENKDGKDRQKPVSMLSCSTCCAFLSSSLPCFKLYSLPHLPSPMDRAGICWCLPNIMLVPSLFLHRQQLLSRKNSFLRCPFPLLRAIPILF